MILVDTSAWIEFFRKGPKSRYGEMIQNWLTDEEDLCLTDFIVTEILQGIKSDTEFAEIRAYLLDFPIISPRGLDSYVNAAEIYRTCRKKGITLNSTIDCLIAQVALENALTLFHKDRDYDCISDFFPLDCLPVE